MILAKLKDIFNLNFVMSNNAIDSSNICVLISENNPELKFVLVDKEPLVLGRALKTGLVDRRLSKQQCKQNTTYYIFCSYE